MYYLSSTGPLSICATHYRIHFNEGFREKKMFFENIKKTYGKYTARKKSEKKGKIKALR